MLVPLGTFISGDFSETEMGKFSWVVCLKWLFSLSNEWPYDTLMWCKSRGAVAWSGSCCIWRGRSPSESQGLLVSRKNCRAPSVWVWRVGGKWAVSLHNHCGSTHLGSACVLKNWRLRTHRQNVGSTFTVVVLCFVVVLVLCFNSWSYWKIFPYLLPLRSFGQVSCVCCCQAHV